MEGERKTLLLIS